MKYVATIEIEFETDKDPMEVLHILARRTTTDIVFDGSNADCYHIISQPRETK